MIFFCSNQVAPKNSDPLEDFLVLTKQSKGASSKSLAKHFRQRTHQKKSKRGSPECVSHTRSSATLLTDA
jgi:hypothetical protein